MAGIDFMLSDTSDIQIVDGKFVLLETIPQGVRQRLQTKFRTWKGEWFLNTTYGIPYKEGVYGGVFNKGILGKGYSKTDIDSIYISAATEDEDVIRVTYFNSDLDRVSRLYDVTMDVLTTDGKIRVVIPATSPNDEIEYPIPSEFIVTPDCGATEVPMTLGDSIVQTTTPLNLIAATNNYLVIGTYDGYVTDGYVVDGYLI